MNSVDLMVGELSTRIASKFGKMFSDTSCVAENLRSVLTDYLNTLSESERIRQSETRIFRVTKFRPKVVCGRNISSLTYEVQDIDGITSFRTKKLRLSTRMAKQWFRRRLKDALLTDLYVTPIKPLEHFYVTCTITNNENHIS